MLVLVLVGVLHLQAGGVTNMTVVIQESWETISNRWGSVSLEQTKQAAKHGDVSAQYYLGCAYEDGNGVPIDNVESFKWVTLAAQQGLSRAQRTLGFKYENGLGVETNFSEAWEWFQKASKLGDPYANYLLGTLCFSGRGVVQDYSAAAKYFRLAAENGIAFAQSSLGYLYREGLGVPKDLNQSAKWYQKAADQGVAEAQRNLGYAYEMGLGVSKDYTEAAQLYRLAADQADATAENNLGFCYYRGVGVPQNSGEAVKWYLKSAEQGAALGQANIGWMYEHGDGIERNHELALKWTKAAADQGFAKAQLQMGDFLEIQFDATNKWIPDHAAAIDWYSKAATQGVVEAMMKVGDLYFHQNAYSEIVKWYGMAATNGNAEAARKLGDLYLYNRPEHPLDHKEALHWYQIAAEKDDPEAQYQVGCLLKEGKNIPHDAVGAETWLKKAADNGFSEAALKIASLHNLPATSVLTNLSRADLEVSAYHANGKTRLPLGIAYEEGVGGEKDMRQAVNAYCWILNLGPRDDQPEALRRMINLYATGQIKPEPMAQPANVQGVLGALGYYYEIAPKDTNQMANFLLRWKSQISSPKTLYQIGVMFDKGISVPMDKTKSLDWFRLAAKAGDAEAQKRLQQP